MLICKTYFSKLQSDPNSDHTIAVYAIKKRTLRDPNSRPGETDPYTKIVPLQIYYNYNKLFAVNPTQPMQFFCFPTQILCAHLWVSPYSLPRTEIWASERPFFDRINSYGAIRIWIRL